MARILRLVAAGVGALVITAGLAVAAWHVVDGTPRIAAPEDTTTQFDAAQLLVLVDADMAATAYADGALHPIEGAEDALIILDDPGEADAERRLVTASNTVMGWPGAMVADRQGRFAYIIENRGPVDLVHHIRGERLFRNSRRATSDNGGPARGRSRVGCRHLPSPEFRRHRTVRRLALDCLR